MKLKKTFKVVAAVAALAAGIGAVVYFIKNKLHQEDLDDSGHQPHKHFSQHQQIQNGHGHHLRSSRI